MLGLQFAAVAADAEKPAPAGLVVTSYPEKARIFVDGKSRGTTPVSIYDLPAGRHWVRAELPGYVSEDRYATLQQGADKRIDFPLERETGLLLVTSDPSGAEVVDVEMNRTHLGTTPLLVTKLAAGRDYTLELSKQGFGTRRTRVRLAGREPVAIHEVLRNDSGTLVCNTEPEGAEVTVNGIPRGKTPLELSVPMGRVQITCKKEGYKDVFREIILSAGASESITLPLEGIPATLAVVSTPDRADVFLDGEYKGRSPVTIESVAPGAHVVKVSAPGYAAAAKSIQAKFGEKLTETFALASVLGRIEVVSSPAGAQVFVDGKFKGRTKGKGAKSEILTIDPVEAGEHTVTLKLARHAEASARVTVEPRKAASVSRTLKKVFTKDFEIVTVSGSVYQGELLESTPFGYNLAVSEGMVRFFPNEEVHTTRPLQTDN